MCCHKEGRAKYMAKHGKKYREAEKLVEEGKLYQPQEAVSLLKRMNYVTFDPTVAVHMKLGVDPRPEGEGQVVSAVNVSLQDLPADLRLTLNQER